jgi:hypothetical protein
MTFTNILGKLKAIFSLLCPWIRVRTNKNTFEPDPESQKGPSESRANVARTSVLDKLEKWSKNPLFCSTGLIG